MTMPSRAVPLLVAFPLFMANLDQTILFTAIPRMAADLGRTPEALAVIVSAYIMALVASMPMTGWLVARFGSRNVFLGAVVVFGAGSLACALSGDLTSLTAARVLQGLGGGLMTPVARVVLQESVPKAALVRAMAWYTTPALLGPTLGPTLGGLLLTVGDWPLIFLVNLPFVAGAVVLGLRLLPAGDRPEVPPPFDWRGYALLLAGLILTIFALTAFEHGIALGPLAALAVGVAALAAYACHAVRAAAPLMRLTMLAEPVYRRLIVSGGFFRLGTAALPFLASIALQAEHGIDPARTGLMLSAVALGAVCAKPLAYAILRRLGYRATMLGNVAGTVLALIAVALLLGAPALWPLATVAALFASGFLRSVQFTALNSLNYLTVPRLEMGSATTLASIAQQLSIGTGVVLANLGLTLLGLGVPATLGIIAGLAMLSALPLMRLDRAVGDEMLGRGAKPS